jgi:hypothetical protein
MGLGAGKPRMALCRSEADLLASALLPRKASRFEYGGADFAKLAIGLADRSLPKSFNASRCARSPAGAD